MMYVPPLAELSVSQKGGRRDACTSTAMPFKRHQRASEAYCRGVPEAHQPP
jgi:hypothetical protein